MNFMGPSYEAALKANYQDIRHKFLPVPKPKIAKHPLTEAEKKLAALKEMFVVHEVEAFQGLERRVTTAKKIIFETAKKHKVSVSEMKGEGRHRTVVYARHEAMYRIRDELGLSFPRISRALCRSDHSTSIHGYKSHKKRMEAANGLA